MKEYWKEIIICLIALLIAGGTICFFYRSLQAEKEIEKVNLYKVIPAGSEVILHINRIASLSHICEQNPEIKEHIHHYIPPVFLSLLEIQTLKKGIISFHPPHGSLFYTSVSPKQNKQIEKLISETWFPAYAAQQYENNDFNFVYYPDTASRFFGYFYINGVWVGSYNRKLLEESARLYSGEHTNQTPLPEDIFKNTDIGSPLNLYIKEDCIFSDSLSLKNENWISADIFLSEGHTCLFTLLPAGITEDEKADSLATLLTEKVTALFPGIFLQHQLQKEDTDYFFTLCTP